MSEEIQPRDVLIELKAQDRIAQANQVMVLNELQAMEQRNTEQRDIVFADLKEAQAETNIHLVQLNGTVATNCKLIDAHTIQLSSLYTRQAGLRTAQAVTEERCEARKDIVSDVQDETKTNREKIGKYAATAAGFMGLGVVVAELIHRIP